MQGNNVRSESYGKDAEHQRPFATPKKWLTDMETTGVWSFEYFTEKGLEDWTVRRKIAEKMLGWKFEEASFGEGTGGSSQHSELLCCLLPVLLMLTMSLSVLLPLTALCTLFRQHLSRLTVTYVFSDGVPTRLGEQRKIHQTVSTTENKEAIAV